MLNRDDSSWPRRVVINKSYLKYAAISAYEYWLYFTGEDPEFVRPEDYGFFEIYNYSSSSSLLKTGPAKKLPFPKREAK